MTMKTSKISKKRVGHPSDQIHVHHHRHHHHHHHHHHHVPGLLQTSMIMASQSSLSSVIMMSSLLRDSFLVTKLFILSVHFVRCLPLFPLYSIFACLVHQLSLYNQKLKLSFSWLFWIEIFCIRSFPLLLRFCSFQSMIFSFFFWCRPYHILVVCNHCKTLLVKERDTDQSEVYSFEKNNMIPQPTVAYLHEQIPLEKFSKQLSILSEKMHHLWLFQQHCVSSLSRRWLMLH